MLPAAHRLTNGQTFRFVIRDGRQAGSRTLVVHLANDAGARDPRVGLVVSRAVGNSVVADHLRRTAEEVREGRALWESLVERGFMTDLAEFSDMNSIYGEFFKSNFPARSTIQVAALPRGAKVEIEVIACYPTP